MIASLTKTMEIISFNPRIYWAKPVNKSRFDCCSLNDPEPKCMPLDDRHKTLLVLLFGSAVYLQDKNVPGAEKRDTEGYRNRQQNLI